MKLPKQIIKQYKLLLKPLNTVNFEIKEISIIPLRGEQSGKIVSVEPSSYDPVYTNATIVLNGYKQGKSPFLLLAMGMVNISLPCTVEKIILERDYPCLCKTCEYIVDSPKGVQGTFSCSARKHRRIQEADSCDKWKIGWLYDMLSPT